jgi:hypothetical protein
MKVVRKREDYTQKNCMGCAYHVVLLGLSKCGGKRFGKQFRGGPGIDGLNNTTNNMDRRRDETLSCICVKRRDVFVRVI